MSFGKVTSVHHAASEVGGDFFHVSPDRDSSLQAIVGEVSGRNLTAAMYVAINARRATAQSIPRGARTRCGTVCRSDMGLPPPAGMPNRDLSTASLMPSTSLHLSRWQGGQKTSLSLTLGMAMEQECAAISARSPRAEASF